ncbi:MAG: 16S rRNA (guanine(527)-N(7))-methyltransferase RsmG [Chloroflexi bacterium]|nr:16S rRNA (guanine(527)-N(7))-methyltransferase RsmG [Chloroflexota bacterium]
MLIYQSVRYKRLELLKTQAKKLGIELSDDQLLMFETYYKELIDWNKRVNLTTITDYDDVQTKHFLDSITAIPYLPNLMPFKAIDIGSGGGFPGIPLKIMRPDIELTLVESRGKKAQFLKHVLTALKLDGVRVITARAETAASEAVLRGKYDIALTRAVGSISTVLELTLPFLKTGGVSVIYKKGEINDDLSHATEIAPLLGGIFSKTEPILHNVFPDNRCLLFFSKVSPTSDRYPRRDGMPAKRPL